MNGFRTAILGAALALASIAAQAASPVVGTWVLDAAKSKFEGAAPKSGVRTYEETPAGMHMVGKMTAADGKEIVQESTFKSDGKDYAFTGVPDWDAISAKTLPNGTVAVTHKRGGKVVGHTTRTLSADGKTLTLKGSYKKAAGGTGEMLLVYTRK
jgi:hypothetical protein